MLAGNRFTLCWPQLTRRPKFADLCGNSDIKIYLIRITIKKRKINKNKLIKKKAIDQGFGLGIRVIVKLK